MKTLKEVYGFEKKTRATRKLTAESLRSVILEEYKAALLKEQEEAQPEEAAEEDSGRFTGEYRGDSVDKSTNVKDVDPVEIANQLLSGDDDAPIVQSSQGNWFAYDGAAAKAWIEKVGPDVFVSRLEALSAKVPTSGIPKSKMPFLPGPDDASGTVAQVKDALTPGGELNIDMMDEGALVKGLNYLMEKQAPPAPNTFTGHDPDLEKGAAADFLTGGLKDGNPSDDVVTINIGGSVNASSAIPTQSNILIYKSMGFAVNGMAGGDLDAWAGTGGEILDGHHRWAATMLNDPGADLGTAGQVDLNATGDPKEMLMYLTALGNALGNATKTESRRHSKGDVIVERWKRLAGIL